MKPLRRLLAFLGAIPLLLGLLVPAAAMPCADGGGAPMSCDACLVGILPGAVACASLSQAVPAPEPAAARAPRPDVQAWFADLVIRPYGFHPVPEAPPPR